MTTAATDRVTIVAPGQTYVGKQGITYGAGASAETVGAERGYIDDVIMPHSTRRRLARALAMLKGKKVEMPGRKHDNLPL